MAMRIAAELLNGETLELEVRPEMTIRQVKQQIKDMQRWDDDVSRNTTVVELIVGDKKIRNHQTVAQVCLLDDARVSAVFRPNVARCSVASGFGHDLDREALVVVEIPAVETELREFAFAECSRVAKVIIPSSLTRIGDYAFDGCGSLVSINIPASVTYIGQHAFDGCKSLVSINIPDSVTQISPRTFLGCRSLVCVRIPWSVTRIQYGAFAACSGLASLEIPDSVTSIGEGAFDDCVRLTLTAPARLLGEGVGDGIKMVAKECACGRCEWSWFRQGWFCPFCPDHLR